MRKPTADKPWIAFDLMDGENLGPFATSAEAWAAARALDIASTQLDTQEAIDEFDEALANEDWYLLAEGFWWDVKRFDDPRPLRLGGC